MEAARAVGYGKAITDIVRKSNEIVKGSRELKI